MNLLFTNAIALFTLIAKQMRPSISFPVVVACSSYSHYYYWLFKGFQFHTRMVCLVCKTCARRVDVRLDCAILYKYAINIWRKYIWSHTHSVQTQVHIYRIYLTTIKISVIQPTFRQSNIKTIQCKRIVACSAQKYRYNKFSEFTATFNWKKHCYIAIAITISIVNHRRSKI